MTISAEKCRVSALKYGADQSHIWRRDQIPIAVFIGLGGHFCDYWVWKSYMCLAEARTMEDGDILVYSDAGIEFINNIRSVANTMNDDIFLFSNGWKHIEWCKMDVMEQIGVDPGEEKQVQASLMFFRINEKTIRFLSEWFHFCSFNRLINDSPSITPNVATFAAHRHDQAILSTLAIRDKIPLHWYPVTTAHHIKAEYNDTYPEIALHHRKRNNEW